MNGNGCSACKTLHGAPWHLKGATNVSAIGLKRPPLFNATPTTTTTPTSIPTTTRRQPDNPVFP